MSRLVKLMLLLVLANVAIFLWPNKANLAPHIYAERAELNPHFVRLNKEIEDRFYSKADGNVVIESQSSSAAPTLVSDIEVNVASNNARVPSDGVCYRLGPFTHQASYELAQAVLFNADVNYQKSKRASQKSDVYRLYLGPFNNRADVAQARLNLKQLEIFDHFARKVGDSEYIISLGIYSTQESAEAALRLFAGKLDEIRVRNETVVLPDSYWLHFALQESSPRFAQLNAIDWGESSVKLGPHDCRN